MKIPNFLRNRFLQNFSRSLFLNWPENLRKLDNFCWMIIYMNLIRLNKVSLVNIYNLIWNKYYRSSHQRCSIKIFVLKNFAKFTGKHLCQCLSFKVAGLMPANLLKKRLWHRCFPVNFVKFLRKPFSTDHLWWLLLNLTLT